MTPADRLRATLALSNGPMVRVPTKDAEALVRAADRAQARRDDLLPVREEWGGRWCPAVKRQFEAMGVEV